jgi:hypothetical protein
VLPGAVIREEGRLMFGPMAQVELDNAEAKDEVSSPKNILTSDINFKFGERSQ